MIDSHLLRTFLAVCNEGSISGAARRRNISQPSVSVAMAQLERSLKALLFGRGRQGITLTREGIALQRRAEMMEVLLAESETAVALAGAGVRGPLRIGGTPGAGQPGARGDRADGTRRPAGADCHRTCRRPISPTCCAGARSNPRW